MTPEKSRTHKERFRCPQCGQMVTVTAGFTPAKEGKESMVRFECTMEGRCGSPIWDPCPMYVAYMERTPQEAAEKAEAPKKRSNRNSLKDAW